ncbi:hypothetical protein C8R43DRAFT_943450 [Mycena crocata]|nr:hypothetical protein C8R43DRAFT_943450 [Mycena crocata]
MKMEKSRKVFGDDRKFKGQTDVEKGSSGSFVKILRSKTKPKSKGNKTGWVNGAPLVVDRESSGSFTKIVDWGKKHTVTHLEIQGAEIIGSSTSLLPRLEHLTISTTSPHMNYGDVIGIRKQRREPDLSVKLKSLLLKIELNEMDHSRKRSYPRPLEMSVLEEPIAGGLDLGILRHDKDCYSIWPANWLSRVIDPPSTFMRRSTSDPSVSILLDGGPFTPGGGALTVALLPECPD